MLWTVQWVLSFLLKEKSFHVFIRLNFCCSLIGPGLHFPLEEAHPARSLWEEHGLLSETAAGKQAYIFIDIDTKSNWLSVTLINTCYMSLFRFTSSSGVATNSSLLSSRSAVASMASSSSKSFGSLPRTPPWLAWKIYIYIYILQLHLIMIHYLYNNLSDMKLLFTF